jgi:hypothetical protein
VVTDVDDVGGQAVMDKIGSASEAIFLHQDVTLSAAAAVTSLPTLRRWAASIKSAPEPLSYSKASKT